MKRRHSDLVKINADLIRVNQKLTDQVTSLTRQCLQLQAQCGHYAQSYDSLVHQVKQMQRDRFGQRSERYTDPENPQTSMFDAGVGQGSDCV